MGRDTIQLETAVSTISPEYLLEFTSEYGISEDLHPKFPGPEERIVDFPEGKVGVYTKFFEFVNFRLPISQFLFDILGHYQIHLSQLSVIGAAKVDERVFPTVVDWRINALKDEMPVRGSYSVEDVAVLNTRRTPIQKQPEALLCIVGLSRRYFLGDDVYPTFLNDDDQGGCFAQNPTNVRTGSRPRAAHEVRDEVIRFRYGDEQHLDEALKHIFQYGLGSGVARRNAPVLKKIHEELFGIVELIITEDGKYCLVLVFEAKALELADFEKRQLNNNVPQQKFATFFGPGIIAEVGTGEEHNMFDVRLISDMTL
ncbi:gypsy type transposase, partial [Tanacetum coccineum]